MHPRHIANSIAKRRREMNAKMEKAAQENNTQMSIDALGDFLAEMDLLVVRIRDEEDAKDLNGAQA